ncbi:4-hydroxy-tetrahydrodipicolinate reductase [Reichenbachiella sp. MALMAid0571]|uniref:4-hydroxy-tetrahydrodipicolinate reductase n=1 Tax=Reichenbachiella sp. MALMAid0571 TaxID=3143939 RepID=UPI0032DFF287
MRIALVGYGKMGQLIEKLAIERGNTISKVIDLNNSSEITEITPDTTDVVIEFTSPESAFNNIMSVLKQKVPVVSGSTGWLDKMPEVEKYCKENSGTFFYASNYSLGVNIFFKVNKYLAELMAGKGYKVSVEDIHHIHKLDAPSGTGITIAEGIIEKNKDLSSWKEGEASDSSVLSIYSKREGEVPGTHSVNYTSEIDDIRITHEAHTRKGFAMGAVMVAEWLSDKKGVFNMDDYLNFSL